MADMGKFRPNKKMVLSVLGVAAVLTLSLGAGMGLRMLQDKDKNNSASQDIVKGQPLPGASEEVQQLRFSGNDEAAATKINEALSKSNASDDERYTLYIQQGNIASDKKDLNAAIESYVKALEIKETHEITKLLGLTWEEMGNKEKAIEYYKRAIPLTPESPMQQSNKETLEVKIRNLGGTP